MPDSEQSQIDIKIVSHPRYACVVRSAVEKASQLFGMCDRDCGRIMLCVDEAITNVMRHGYKGATDKVIHVMLNPIEKEGQKGIRIVIEDEACDVDLASIKSQKSEEIRPGGLGVHIIYDVMDSVEYTSREPEKGVRLEMIKYTSS